MVRLEVVIQCYINCEKDNYSEYVDFTTRLISILNKLKLQNITFVMEADSSSTERIWIHVSDQKRVITNLFTTNEYNIDMKTSPEEVLQLCLTEFQKRVDNQLQRLTAIQETIDNATQQTKQIHLIKTK